MKEKLLFAAPSVSFSDNSAGAEGSKQKSAGLRLKNLLEPAQELLLWSTAGLVWADIIVWLCYSNHLLRVWCFKQSWRCSLKNKARPLLISSSAAALKWTAGHSNVQDSSMLSDRHHHYGNKVPPVPELCFMWAVVESYLISPVVVMMNGRQQS